MTAPDALIAALPPDSVLAPLKLSRVAVVSSLRRLVYSRHYEPDRRARWSGLWVDRLSQLEAADIAYPFGPLGAAWKPITKDEYEGVAELLRDAENLLLKERRTS